MTPAAKERRTLRQQVTLKIKKANPHVSSGVCKQVTFKRTNDFIKSLVVAQEQAKEWSKHLQECTVDKCEHPVHKLKQEEETKQNEQSKAKA